MLAIVKQPLVLISYQACLSCDRLLQIEKIGGSYLQYELPREGDVVRKITVGGTGIQHIRWMRINIGDVDAWTWNVSLSTTCKFHPISIPIAINLLAIGCHTCALQICMHKNTDELWMHAVYELRNDKERYHLAKEQNQRLWYEMIPEGYSV